MAVIDSELDTYLKINHRGATRSSETASQVTLAGTLTANELLSLMGAASARGWHLEMVAGALILKVGKG